MYPVAIPKKTINVCVYVGVSLSDSNMCKLYVTDAMSERMIILSFVSYELGCSPRLTPQKGRCEISARLASSWRLSWKTEQSHESGLRCPTLYSEMEATIKFEHTCGLIKHQTKNDAQLYSNKFMVNSDLL